MKQMSLRDFKKEYFPNMKGIEFSEMLGFDNSLINKVLNGKYDCSLKSPKWVELKNYMKTYYEIDLINTSKTVPFFETIDNKEKTIDRLKKENAELKQEVEELEELVANLMKGIKLSSDIRNTIEYGIFKLEKWRRRK